MNDKIEHHGILGMKWGLRRYQNSDGSLTPAGKRRAQSLKGEYKVLTGKKLKGKIQSDEDPSKKSVKKLSDTELSNRIKRLSNEKQALMLEKDINNETASKSNKFFKTIGKEVITPAAINAGRDLLTNWLKKQGTKIMGLNEQDISDAEKAFRQLKRDTEISQLKNQKYQADKQLKDSIQREKEKKQSQKNNQTQDNKSSKGSSDKESTLNINIYNVKKEDINRGKSVFNEKFKDAEYKEKSSIDLPYNSPAGLLPYSKKGKKIFDDVFN